MKFNVGEEGGRLLKRKEEIDKNKNPAAGAKEKNDKPIIQHNVEQLDEKRQQKRREQKPRHMFFEDDDFVAKEMAEWFLKDHPSFVMANELYIYSNGVYRHGESLFMREATLALDRNFKRNYVGEALAYIKNTISEVMPDEANNTGNLLNLANGILNLDTREFRSHDPSFKTIIQLPTVYDPAATCPAFDEFLKTVVPEDCISVIWEMFGYILQSDMQHELSFMMFGNGKNGKGTLISVISHLLGASNVSSVSIQSLSENRFAAANLYGKMANLDADLPSSEVIDSSRFKKLTSGDSIDAEIKHKQGFNFNNRAKMVFSTNELPVSRDNTDGFHRRWIIIPFRTKFEDRKLRKKLFSDSEMSGILNAALVGFRRLKLNGTFSQSETINQMLNSYREESDTVLRFVTENCKPCQCDEGFASNQSLYDSYKSYCIDVGNRSLSRTRFNARLLDIFPHIRLDTNGVRKWKGIQLINY